MKHKKYLLFFLLISSCILFRCRKYDECTAFPSFRDAEAVLLKGVWRIEKYEVNGVDSTDFILSNPYYSDITFKDDGIQGTAEGTYSAGVFNDNYYFRGGELYLSGRDTLAVSHNALFVRDSIFRPAIKFQITCCRKKHFWIKVDYEPGGYTYNHNNYYIRFKNVK